MPSGSLSKPSGARSLSASSSHQKPSGSGPKYSWVMLSGLGTERATCTPSRASEARAQPRHRTRIAACMPCAPDRRYVRLLGPPAVIPRSSIRCSSAACSLASESAGSVSMSRVYHAPEKPMEGRGKRGSSAS